MKIKIMIPDSVEIPKSELEDCAKDVVERFNMSGTEPINAYDLVTSAQLLGIIERLPEGWELENEYEEYEQSELIKPTKKAKKGD